MQDFVRQEQFTSDVNTNSNKTCELLLTWDKIPSSRINCFCSKNHKPLILNPIIDVSTLLVTSEANRNVLNVVDISRKFQQFTVIWIILVRKQPQWLHLSTLNLIYTSPISTHTHSHTWWSVAHTHCVCPSQCIESSVFQSISHTPSNTVISCQGSVCVCLFDQKPSMWHSPASWKPRFNTIISTSLNVSQAEAASINSDTEMRNSAQWHHSV